MQLVGHYVALSVKKWYNICLLIGSYGTVKLKIKENNHFLIYVLYFFDA
jgi:hypothetical protein